MQKKLAILAALIISVSLVNSAYAHKAQVVGDYKIEIGWKNEPPIAGKKNAIEIMIVKATAVDKKSNDDHGSHDAKKSNDDHGSHDAKKKPTTTTSYDETHQTMKHKSTEDKMHKHDAKKTTKKATGITGLSKTLEVDVTLNDKKTFLKLVEDKKNKGTYYGTYTPDSEGFPTVHIVGKIKNTPVEITLHPEKVVK
ncbi:MAG: hypothetical protein ACK4TO_00775 [Candidatus Nitrosotenuis sp.]